MGGGSGVTDDDTSSVPRSTLPAVPGDAEVAMPCSHAGRSSMVRIVRGSIGEMSGGGMFLGGAGAIAALRQAGGRRSHSGMPLPNPPSGIGSIASGSPESAWGSRLLITGV